MTVTLSTILRPAVATRSNRPVRRPLRAWLRDIQRYFVHRAAVGRLREFSDRELRDIGLTRSQIESAVCGFIARPDRTRI